MSNNLERNIGIHLNLNRQELREVVIGNNSYSSTPSKPSPNSGDDIGLLYYDTYLGKIMVWDGSEWKISQFLDDRDLTYSGDIYSEDIWSDSDLIPPTPPSSSSNIVELVTGVTLSNVSGTYDYKGTFDDIEYVVPSYKYGNGYEPILTDSNGATVSNSGTESNWRLDREQVTVYSGFQSSPYIINETDSLFLSYWKYIGDMGISSGGSASTTKDYVDGEIDTLDSRIVILEEVEYWTVELMDTTETIFYADNNIEISNIINVKNNPTTTIKVNGSAYTLGNTISIGDEITITVDIPSVIKLKTIR